MLWHGGAVGILVLPPAQALDITRTRSLFSPPLPPSLSCALELALALSLPPAFGAWCFFAQRAPSQPNIETHLTPLTWRARPSCHRCHTRNRHHPHQADPANKLKICKRGFWAYSRHPNYYGEILMFWGMFISGIPVWLKEGEMNLASDGWVTILSPVFTMFVLLFLSGVPIAEGKALKR